MFLTNPSISSILTPPFNSQQDYNVLFAEHSGARAAAQIKAFGDTWRWDLAAESAYVETVEAGSGHRVADVLRALRTFLGNSDMMAYIAMMAPRLVELRRSLRPTGSLYLHCDPTASHYLKILLDAVFGPENFRSEIVWKRSSAHSDSKQGRKQLGHVHDVILFYTRSGEWTWNPLHADHDPDYIAKKYPYEEPLTGRRYGLWDMSGPGGAAKGNPSYEVMGVVRFWRYSRTRMQELIAAGLVVQPSPGAVPRQKRYLDETPGVSLQDLWTDIPPINSQAQERLGYPTQKPEALLERIIALSSNPGDLVLDPFCGCGTAIAAAQKLGRRWMGIDITHLAINLIRHRLQTTFGSSDAPFTVIGEPVSVPDAENLAASDPYQFQWWSLGLVGARPAQQKKGADKGIDGRLYFHDEGPSSATKQIIFSVKAGKVTTSQLRDLLGVLDREKAQIGVLISLLEPTKDMRTEAAAAGFYESRWGRHPRLQLLTVKDLLGGRKVDYPPTQANVTFKKAPKAQAADAQHALPL